MFFKQVFQIALQRYAKINKVIQTIAFFIVQTQNTPRRGGASRQGAGC
jgi:hypothetical protein